MNLRWGDDRLALTYCPITGSSLVFDRNSIGGAELGVSGVQFMGNLVMYDRQSDQSLWPDRGCPATADAATAAARVRPKPIRFNSIVSSQMDDAGRPLHDRGGPAAGANLQYKGAGCQCWSQNRGPARDGRGV